jgi:hypothetical protein
MIKTIAPGEISKKGQGGGIRDNYLKVLNEILKLFDQRVHHNGTIMSLLESLKNAFIGKVHMPHSPMIDHGLHAITIEGTHSKSLAKKESKNQYEDNSVKEAKKVGRVLQLMERSIRTLDQVDEMLHAGYFFYILTGNGQFVSNSVFLYPIVVILFSYFLPAVLDYYDHMELEEKQENTKMRPEIIFVGMVFITGMVFTSLPGREFCSLEHSE